MMTKEEREFHERRLALYDLQIHMTVLYEDDFWRSVGGKRNLEIYRDEILDRINVERRILSHF